MVGDVGDGRGYRDRKKKCVRFTVSLKNGRNTSLYIPRVLTIIHTLVLQGEKKRKRFFKSVLIDDHVIK